MKCHPERWVWGLIPIAMLSWIAVNAEADRIERDLEQRSERVLRAAGLDWAAVAFSGRDGLLVGTPRGPRERDAALALVRGIWGVGSVSERTRSLEEVVAVELGPERDLSTDLPEMMTPAGIRTLPETRPTLVVTARPVDVREPPPDTVRAREPPHGTAAVGGLSPDPVAAYEPPAAAALPPAVTAAHPDLVQAYEPPADPAAVTVTAASADPADTKAQRAAAPDTETVVRPDRVRAPAPPTAAAPAPEPATTSEVLPSSAPQAGTPAPPPEQQQKVAPHSGGSSGGTVAVATAALARSVALAADQCRSAAAAIGTLEPVRFASDAAKLSAQQQARLDRLAAAASACPSAKLQISGHADSDGAARHNMALSLRRAKVAMSYLMAKGIDAGRLKAVGYGETRPIAPNDTAQNRAKNRRIEVEVTGIGPQKGGPAASAREGAGNGLSDR